MMEYRLIHTGDEYAFVASEQMRVPQAEAELARVNEFRNIDWPAELAALRAAPPKIDGVLAEITAERAKQDAQWGGSAHDDEHVAEDWISYICKFLERANEGHSAYRGSMVKIAALAVAAIESHDRKNNAPKETT